MNAIQEILIESTTRLLTDQCTDSAVRSAMVGSWNAQLWEALEDAGLPLAVVDESHGGSGFEVTDGLELVRLAGRFLTPAPLGESILANLLLLRAGLEPARGVLSLAPASPTDQLLAAPCGDGWAISGTATRVPWARFAGHIVLLAHGPTGPVLACVASDAWSVTQKGSNLAGLPCDSVTFGARICGSRVAPVRADGLTPFLAGAALRSLQIAGAAERVLNLTAGYVQERVQFGRPIGSFQAVQQELARMASHVVAVGAAADSAVAAVVADAPVLAIAAAKVRCAEAAGVIAGIAHQLHGAMGFADEYSLGLVTRHLLSWRDEYGSQTHWSRVIGESVLTAGADSLWQFVTEV